MLKMPLSLPRFKKQLGALAQLVEQWTENPCVPSSILGGTTSKSRRSLPSGFFYCGIRFSEEHHPKHVP